MRLSLTAVALYLIILSSLLSNLNEEIYWWICSRSTYWHPRSFEFIVRLIMACNGLIWFWFSSNPTRANYELMGELSLNTNSKQSLPVITIFIMRWACWQSRKVFYFAFHLRVDYARNYICRITKRWELCCLN